MLTAEHPYHEPLWGQLITAYYLSERQSEALDAFSRLKANCHAFRLIASLGIPPGNAVTPGMLDSVSTSRLTSAG